MAAAGRCRDVLVDETRRAHPRAGDGDDLRGRGGQVPVQRDERPVARCAYRRRSRALRGGRPADAHAGAEALARARRSFGRGAGKQVAPEASASIDLRWTRMVVTGMRFARLAKVAAAIVVTSCFTARAEAAYDMSDKWLVSPSGLRFDLTQSDGTVGGTADGRTVAGTIDETTGEFHLRFGNSFPCPVDFFDGNIAAGNESFTATWTHVQLVVISRFDIRCSSDTSTQSGTRCGNNQIDFGEDCDDGGVADGDCCSSSCTFDDPGTLCTTDYDVCTDDVCDGAGTCEHPDNSAPCADPNGCATGACNAGACVLTTNMTAGTPCDFDSS